MHNCNPKPNLALNEYKTVESRSFQQCPSGTRVCESPTFRKWAPTRAHNTSEQTNTNVHVQRNPTESSNINRYSAKFQILTMKPSKPVVPHNKLDPPSSPPKKKLNPPPPKIGPSKKNKEKLHTKNCCPKNRTTQKLDPQPPHCGPSLWPLWTSLWTLTLDSLWTHSGPSHWTLNRR